MSAEHTSADPETEGWVAASADAVATLTRERTTTTQPVRLLFEAFGRPEVGRADGSSPQRRALDVECDRAVRIGAETRPTLFFRDETDEFVLTDGARFVDQTLDLPDDLEHETHLGDLRSVLGREVSLDDGYEPVGVHVALLIPDTDAQGRGSARWPGGRRENR
jgi:hypothetical protein